MGLESRRNFIDGGQVLDKVVFLTASAMLEVYEQVVECNSTSAAITVTLPDVVEAAGRIYTIALVTDDGGNNVTIQDQNESRNWDGDYTLADADDEYVLYSNGRKWYVLATIGI